MMMAARDLSKWLSKIALCFPPRAHMPCTGDQVFLDPFLNWLDLIGGDELSYSFCRLLQVQPHIGAL